MKNRRWSTEDDALLARLYPTTRTEEVAAALGRSLMATYVRAQALNIRKAEGCHGNCTTLQPWPEDRDRAAT